MSRTASNNSKDSDCTTAMNITDEEEIPDEIVEIVELEGSGDDEESERPETKPCSNGSLNVTVPNYTYIDTSDSSDSTDSESQSDNESLLESSKSSSDSNSDDSSSDSDDSDSYLAYSTGLNPHGRLEKSNERNSTSKDSSNEEQGSGSSKNSTDSEPEEQMEKEVEKSDTGTFPHQLSVIYEDVERPDSESPRPPQFRSLKDWNETPFEATDDPPDDSDAPTVSVSLPLRFKFSVSENNEDVTTVIVGDSTIKPDRSYIKEESRKLKIQESKTLLVKSNDVSANFLVKNDTSVDFVVKKEGFNGKRKGKDHSNEKTKTETVGKYGKGNRGSRGASCELHFEKDTDQVQ